MLAWPSFSRKLLIFAAVALWSAAPLLAVKVNVKYAEADYEQWQTWSFEETKAKSDLDIPEREANLATVRDAVIERLEKQGFAQAAEGQTPDFRVAIEGTMREVFDARNIHTDVTDHVAFVMEGGISSYREGTLMIRILDGESGDLVWTGWVTSQVRNPEKPEKQIRRAVKKILKKFPPKR